MGIENSKDQPLSSSVNALSLGEVIFQQMPKDQGKNFNQSLNS
jgi:hypothetical protein